MSFFREDVIDAWLANDIDESYLTDAELEECLNRVEQGAMQLLIDRCYKRNPGLTFNGQQTETVH